LYAPGCCPHRSHETQARRHCVPACIHPLRTRCRLPQRRWSVSRIDLGDNVTRLKRWFTTATFGPRLLSALVFVMIGFAVSVWVVAAILAPGIFHEHLEMAGLSQNSSEAAHME